MQSSSGNNGLGGDSSSNGNGNNQVDDTRKIISITAMTHSSTEPCPAFLVQWENETSKEWVSLFDIPRGLEHVCVEKYRKKNPEQYAEVMQQAYLDRRCSERGAAKKQTTVIQKKTAPRRPAGKPKNINQYTQWAIEEITDIRMGSNSVEFFTTWADCGTKQWKPIRDFDDGFDHPSIREFGEKNPEKFKKVLEQKEQALNRSRDQRTSKNRSTCTFKELDDDDPEFKVPDDPAMGQELLALHNTRLRSDYDELLSSFCGSQRLSRSQAREIRGAGKSGSSSSTRLLAPSQKKNQTEKIGKTGDAKPSALSALKNAVLFPNTQQSGQGGEKKRKLIDPTTSDEEEENIAELQAAEKRRRFSNPRIQQVAKPDGDEQMATHISQFNSSPNASPAKYSSDSSDDDSDESSDDGKPGALERIYAKVKAANEKKLNPDSSESAGKKKKNASQRKFRQLSSSSDDSSDEDLDQPWDDETYERICNPTKPREDEKLDSDSSNPAVDNQKGPEDSSNEDEKEQIDPLPSNERVVAESKPEDPEALRKRREDALKAASGRDKAAPAPSSAETRVCAQPEPVDPKIINRECDDALKSAADVEEAAPEAARIEVLAQSLFDPEVLKHLSEEALKVLNELKKSVQQNELTLTNLERASSVGSNENASGESSQSRQ